VHVIPESADAQFEALLPSAMAILHVLKPIGVDVFEQAPHLRLVQKIGVGVNTIDLDAARERGVAVCNMPGTNTAAVVEMTLALMLAALRRLPQFDRSARHAAGWTLPAGSEARLGEIGSRTVGLVGAGAVPRRLSAILAAMDATVLYWSRSERPEMFARFVPWRELLERSDILSLHLPLTTETQGLLDRAALARLRPGAVLINTARGGLVEEGALIEALDSKRLSIAALDVLAAEPPGKDHPLLARDDVIVTPHIAWLTAETWDRSLGVARENVLRALRGEALLRRVV
jgi:phosphoglycerate dehydrogenase-like enzyme